MSIFSDAIKRIASVAAEEAIMKGFEPGGHLYEEARRVAGLSLPDDAPMNRQQFTVAVIRRLIAYGATVGYAKPAGTALVADFLKDEGIRFGDRAYGWDRNAAHTLAEECEIQHWERRA